MFYDRATVLIEAGAGGNGVVSFRREAHVPKGGPDGGDGGRGGDVVLVCDESRRDLESLRRAPHLRAGRGGHGQGKGRHGARGEDRVTLVPVGTQIEGLDGETFDLVEAGQRAIVARGGSGGHGNKRFASATRQTPRFAERGLPGEAGQIELHLKLMADAGLVGMPNAGKSSLLRVLTAARPKVGAYPFTTTEPMLGVIEYDERQVVLADVPGLIEGAARGEGLGHEFLAHVERCRVLVHLVELAPPEGAPEPRAAYEIVRGELAAHGMGLAERPEIIVLSKADLLEGEALDRALSRWRELSGGPVFAISSATGSGLAELAARLAAEIDDPGRPVETARSGYEAEHATYRPRAEQGYSVERLEEDVFAVRGRGVEALVARHDLSNHEAVAYLETRLAEMGVIAELRRAGFSPPAEVVIGDETFVLDPGP